MRLRDLSIGKKLTLTIVGVTALVLCSAFAFVAVAQVRTFRRDSYEKARLVTRVIAIYSAPTLMFPDREVALEGLRHLGDVPEARYGRLYDAKGNTFVTWGAPPAHADSIDPAMPASTITGDGTLMWVQPVEDKDERYGTLVVALSTRGLEDHITAYLATLGITLVALIALAYVLASRLGKLIVRPTMELTAVARRVSEKHDYTLRAPGGGTDEIGVLRDAFNHMLDEVHARELERDKAELRTREKSQFLANMSHELRTPMNSVIGFSEILMARLPGRVEAKELRFLENIHSSGLHLLGVINDILDLSKVEAGKMTLSLEPLSAVAVGKAVAQIMNGVAGKRSITIAIQAEDLQPRLEVDAVKLKQILYNLLSNAVKFSPEGGTVTLEIRHLEATRSPLGVDATEIAVRDEGPGIDTRDHARIFEEFKQIEGQPAVLEGTGLGLALVKRFVELHRGKVVVESAVGQGARLVVYLPQRQGEPAEGGAGGRQRVLVIEGDAAAYEAIRRQLDQTRYVPQWAKNLDEAIEKVKQARPAAIALDVISPNLDGWEALRALRNDPVARDIPILVIPLDGPRLGPTVDAADFWMLSRLDEAQLSERLRGVFAARGRVGGKHRLLLVDDDPLVHELIRSWVHDPSYDLEHAYSGADGVEQARRRPPDVILLDLLMDGMDGFEVAVRLQHDERTGNVPIVLLTAKDLDESDRQRLRGRIAATVKKGPGVEERLAAAIDALLHAEPLRGGAAAAAVVPRGAP